MNMKMKKVALDPERAPLVRGKTDRQDQVSRDDFSGRRFVRLFSIWNHKNSRYLHAKIAN